MKSKIQAFKERQRELNSMDTALRNEINDATKFKWPNQGMGRALPEVGCDLSRDQFTVGETKMTAEQALALADWIVSLARPAGEEKPRG